MRYRVSAAVIGLVVAATSAWGCGPIQFVTQVTIRAERSLQTAKLHKAKKCAPYEYWGAQWYLEQAKHRAGFGDFQTAYRYGKLSEKMSKKAVTLTKKRIADARDRGKKPCLPFLQEIAEDNTPEPRARASAVVVDGPKPRAAVVIEPTPPREAPPRARVVAPPRSRPVSEPPPPRRRVAEPPSAGN